MTWTAPEEGTWTAPEDGWYVKDPDYLVGWRKIGDEKLYQAASS